MPYSSKKQQAYFNANRTKLEAQGVNVDEWNASSKGEKLPARKPRQLSDRAKASATIRKMQRDRVKERAPKQRQQPPRQSH